MVPTRMFDRSNSPRPSVAPRIVGMPREEDDGFAADVQILTSVPSRRHTRELNADY